MSRAAQTIDANDLTHTPLVRTSPATSMGALTKDFALYGKTSQSYFDPMGSTTGLIFSLRVLTDLCPLLPLAGISTTAKDISS